MNVQIVPKIHERHIMTNGQLVNSESERMCKEASAASFRALSQYLGSLSSVPGIMARLRPRRSAYRIPVEARNPSYNRSQQDALMLNFILIYNSTCFGQIYCPSSGVCPKHVELYIKIKLRNSASYWLLLYEYIRIKMHGPQNVKNLSLVQNSQNGSEAHPAPYSRGSGLL
jgi:hypothetical protein